MVKIYKYPLELLDRQVLKIPVGAQFLHFGGQNSRPQLWALVDPDIPEEEEWTLRIAGTGHEISEDIEMEHLGTMIDENLGLVWHLFFELPEAEETGNGYS